MPDRIRRAAAARVSIRPPARHARAGRGLVDQASGPGTQHRAEMDHVPPAAPGDERGDADRAQLTVFPVDQPGPGDVPVADRVVAGSGVDPGRLGRRHDDPEQPGAGRIPAQVVMGRGHVQPEITKQPAVPVGGRVGNRFDLGVRGQREERLDGQPGVAGHHRGPQVGHLGVEHPGARAGQRPGLVQAGQPAAGPGARSAPARPGRPGRCRPGGGGAGRGWRRAGAARGPVGVTAAAGWVAAGPQPTTSRRQASQHRRHDRATMSAPPAPSPKPPAPRDVRPGQRTRGQSLAASFGGGWRGGRPTAGLSAGRPRLSAGRPGSESFVDQPAGLLVLLWLAAS